MLLPPELIKYILKIKNRNHVKEYMETMRGPLKQTIHKEKTKPHERNIESATDLLTFNFMANPKYN